MGTTQPADLSPSRARFGVLGFCCTLSLITYLDRICISRASSDIRRDLGLGEQQMGVVFAAFSLGYALFEVPGGWMGDRWGARRVLFRIVLCWSIFTALTGCVWTFSLDSGRELALGDWLIPIAFDSFLLLVFIRFLFGIGEAGAYPNLTRVVSDWYPFRERGLAQGMIWMSARIGGAIAPFVIGRMAVALGWRQAFWVLGAIGVVWACVFWRWFRDRPAEHPAVNAAELAVINAGRVPADAADGHAWPGVGLLARSATVWAMCLAAFFVCFGWYFYPTWQPQYLKDVHGFEYEDSTAEILSGLPFLCGALGSLVGGRVSDWLIPYLGPRWGRSLVGLVGFAGAGLCVLATGFATTAAQAVTLLCLAFLINDLAIPTLWATCADMGGKYAGSVAGTMNMVGALGAILSPLLIPVVKAQLEGMDLEARWRIIFIGLASAWFLGAVAWLFIDASRKLADSKA